MGGNGREFQAAILHGNERGALSWLAFEFRVN